MKKLAVLALVLVCVFCAVRNSEARDVDFFLRSIPDSTAFIRIPAINKITGWEVAVARIKHKSGVIFILNFEKPMEATKLAATACNGKTEVSWNSNNKTALVECSLFEGVVEVGPKGNTRKFMVSKGTEITLIMK